MGCIFAPSIQPEIRSNVKRGRFHQDSNSSSNDSDLIPSPCTFEQCKSWIVNNEISEQGNIALIRHPRVLAIYMKHREKNNQQYVKYSDFIKHRIFHCKVQQVQIPADANQNGSRLTKLKAVDLNESFAVLTENEFPYHLESGVQHLVLFSTEKLDKERVQQMIEEKYANREYLWWRNPICKQSIPDIWHIQVLVDCRK
mmetsp:Transcript_22205/g.35624  ORF Transcript_22205/g.35624 Transcript_22205/m.35624 type:complete len:199 (+) Transcript_22205:30-626(+)